MERMHRQTQLSVRKMGRSEFKPSNRLMAKIMEDMQKIHGTETPKPLPTAQPRAQPSRIPPPRKAKTNVSYSVNPLKPAPKPKPKRKRSQEVDDTDSANTDDQRESLIRRAQTVFKPSKKKRESKSPKLSLIHI